MFVKIITGIILGFFSGLFISIDNKKPSGIISIIAGIFSIISIGFIFSSFMYGSIYGIMAIGEVFVSFGIATSIFKEKIEEKNNIVNENT